MASFAHVAIALAAALTLAAACAKCDDTWDSYAGAFFAQKCKRCHGSFGARESIGQNRAKIEGLLASGRMPPQHGRELVALPSENVSPQERERVLRWLSCGRR